MGQYEKDKKELQEKIDQLEHKLKKAKQSGDQADVDKYSRKLADRRAKLAALGKDPIPVTATVVAPRNLSYRRRNASTCGTASSASPTASCRTATRTSAGRRASPATGRTASTGRPWAA